MWSLVCLLLFVLLAMVDGIDMVPDTPKGPWTNNPATITWSIQRHSSPLEQTGLIDAWLVRCDGPSCIKTLDVQCIGRNIDVQLRRLSFKLDSPVTGDDYVIKLSSLDGLYYKYSGEFSIQLESQQLEDGFYTITTSTSVITRIIPSHTATTTVASVTVKHTTSPTTSSSNNSSSTIASSIQPISTRDTIGSSGRALNVLFSVYSTMLIFVLTVTLFV